VNANLALLIDFENIATGCDKEGLGRFDVRVVMRRFKDKGRILVARAYADWTRWARFKQDLTTEGVTMFELSHHGMAAKNRADIALVVDAMELAYTRDFIDTYVILSGDSDFSPLVMRLKELNKRVVGCGTKGSTSRLIADLCDEFIFYDSIRTSARPAEPAPEDDGSLTSTEAFELLLETIENLQRDEPGPVHASVVKTAMKRKEPTFNEVEVGYRSFARFVETAQEKGLVSLTADPRAGGWLVDMPRGADRPAQGPPPPGPEAQKVAALLAEDGLEVGTGADRALIVGEFVAACAERARRNRKCAVEYLAGDVVRRIKQARVSMPSRVIRGVANALGRTGLLVHPDGEPVRTPTAAFVPPTDPAPLLAALDELIAESLAARGLTGSTPGVAEVLGTATRPPRGEGPRADAPEAEAAPTVEAAPAEAEPEAGDAPRKRRRRRRRNGGSSPDAGGETGGESADASEPSAGPGAYGDDEPAG